jgi:hypothetical protein
MIAAHEVLVAACEALGIPRQQRRAVHQGRGLGGAGASPAAVETTLRARNKCAGAELQTTQVAYAVTSTGASTREASSTSRFE